MRMTTEHQREVMRSYYQANKEKIQAQRKALRNSKPDSRFSVMVSNSRTRASLKGWEHDVSVDHLKQLWEDQKGLCAISGAPMSLTTSESRTISDLVSLDRIDNSKGYVEGNVWLTTATVNYMRGLMDVETFLQVCQQITEANK